jgi:hypothetical protein
MEGHPVQINHLKDKQPGEIRLDDVFDLYETDTLIFGSDENLCHVLLHHAAPLQARLVRKNGRFFVFNERGSPGTFIIRKKQPICIVQDKKDQKVLLNMMSMPDKLDYSDIIRRKKLTFRLLPPEKFSFPLEDKDLIVIPPGYKFRFIVR